MTYRDPSDGSVRDMPGPEPGIKPILDTSPPAFKQEARSRRTWSG